MYGDDFINFIIESGASCHILTAGKLRTALFGIDIISVPCTRPFQLKTKLMFVTASITAGIFLKVNC